jgi:hypothetical protein
VIKNPYKELFMKEKFCSNCKCLYVDAMTKNEDTSLYPPQCIIKGLKNVSPSDTCDEWVDWEDKEIDVWNMVVKKYINE